MIKENFYALAYLLLALFLMPLAIMGVFLKAIGVLFLLPMMSVIGDFNTMNNVKKKRELANLRKLKRVLDKKKVKH